MCLKYFVGHSTCHHHEYLGSHHCSLRPCELDTQHFHYIEDDFPVPWPENLKAERRALVCKTCATEQHDKLEEPVQSYAPTNNFQVQEIQPTGYTLPIRVVRVEQDDVTTESTTESKDSNDRCDYDYKSLSDADDEEWTLQEDGRQSSEYGQAHDEVRRGEYLQSQLRDLPNYLMQQRQIPPFVPPWPMPGYYATDNYYHYPMPDTGYLATSSQPLIWPWHGGMMSLCSVPNNAPSTRPDISPLQLSIPLPAVKHTIPASRPQRPATPPPTPPLHPLPPRPTAPFIVGSITAAYLRIQAARRHLHVRERPKQERSSVQDALPARKMALTDFMVKKRAQRGHRRKVDVGAPEEVEDAWSSVPFTGEELDTGCGGEEHAGFAGIGKATCRFSCRLVTLM